MNCVFDQKDQEILDTAQAGRRELNALTSLPREGDVILYPDGTTRRVAYSWHDGAQPSIGCGSVYMGLRGGMSFSGSLDHTIPNKQLVLEGEAAAPVWFFHHGVSGAHRGVNATVLVRRWKYVPA